MKDVLDFLQVAFESPVSTLFTIFLFIAAIKGLYEGVKWIKGELNNWYQVRYKTEVKDENTEQRLDHLEKENQLQFEKLSSLEDGMFTLTDTLDKMRENIRIQTVVSLRAEILRTWHEVMGQGYITQAQYEVFEGLKDVYLSNDGNGLFKNKIIPEVEKLEVKE